MYGSVSLASLCLVFFMVAPRIRNPFLTLAAVFGLAALVVGLVYLYRRFIHRRENRGVIKRRIPLWNPAPAKSSAARMRSYPEIDEKWARVLSFLKRTSQRNSVISVASFPQFMLLGPARTGKTSLLDMADLERSAISSERAAERPGTANADWYFFEHCIVLDTAGNYAETPPAPSNGGEEWEYLLTLMARQRPDEPLNGLVVTVSCEDLLRLDEKSLREQGKRIRGRVEQLMSLSRTRFPIYLLVTRLDALPGVTEMAQLLPPQSLSQAMGYISADPDEPWSKTLPRAFGSVADKLKGLRLLLPRLGKSLSPDLHRLSTEFDRLLPRLSEVAREIFEGPSFKEAPIFHGLYFCGALRVVDHLGRRDGLFVTDFFRHVLPATQRLVQPLLAYRGWRNVTRSLGFLAWACLWAALLGLLTYSFYRNLRVTNPQTGFRQTFALQNDITAPLENLAEVRKDIFKLEKQNRGWGLARLGLTQSLTLEQQVKERYVQNFKKMVLDKIDPRLGFNFATRPWPEQTTDGLVYRLAQGMMMNNPDDPMAQALLRDMAEVVLPRYTEFNAAEARQFADLYHAFVRWGGEDLKKINDLTSALRDWLSREDEALNWILAHYSRDLAPVRLQAFWGGGVPLPAEAAVPGRYTHLAWARLESFLFLVDKGWPRQLGIEERTMAIRTRYKGAYLDSWEALNRSFAQLEIPDGDLPAATATMAGDDNPVFRYLDSMATEVSAVMYGGKGRKWAQQAILLKRIRDVHRQAGTAPVTAPQYSPEWWWQSVREYSFPTDRDRNDTTFTDKAETWSGYLKALKSLAPAAAGPSPAYALIREEIDGESKRFDEAFKQCQR
ncbi:MAG: hypothetical protein C4524_01190, partial [Candidatus Zixiibacteriota bacterium]